MTGLRLDVEGAWRSAFQQDPRLQVFLGVPSRVGHWERVVPPRMLVCIDPALAGPDLAGLSDARVITMSAGCDPPIWIPGDPQPTEAHYTEVAEMNPAFRRIEWADT